MNDFTKEELQHLSCLVYANQHAYDSIEDIPGIEIKIQSLIDNYCEHEKTYEDSAMITACCKCGKYGWITKKYARNSNP